MKFKWLTGAWILIVFLLAGSALAATVSISPANPNGNDNLYCLVGGTTTGVSAHWTSNGFTGEIIANPLNKIYTRGGDTVTCRAWIPSISGMIYAGSASINIINRAPIVFGIPNINVTEDIVYTGIDLDNYVNEPDGDTVTWTAVSNNPNIAVSLLAGNIVRITPSANYTGNGTLAFRATDPRGLFGQQTIIVNVLPVNDPPVINLPNNITFLEDTNGSLDLSLYAYDIDSAVLTFSSSGGVNITVNINPLTNIATFIPDPDFFGSENIIFTVTDGQYNRSDSILVIVLAVNDAPLVDLPDNMTVNEGELVNFSANVSDIDTPVLNYQWDFDSDGVIDSTLQNPNYIYQDNGTYLVTLTVNDGVNFVNDTMLVYVNDLNPFVNFTFIPLNPNENESVQFTDLSSASIFDPISSYAWDFDGDFIVDSTLQNPSFIYLQDGNYTITLTVFDEDSSASFSQNIIVNDLDPVAAFIYAPLNPTEGEQVNFTDTSISYDGIVSWSWDFDNDSIVDSNLQNPNYIFVNNGTYTVVLTIQEADGDTSSFSAVIVVSNNPPIVDLIPSVNNGDEGLFVDFTCNVVNGNLPFNFTLDSGINIQTLTNGASVNFNETYLNNGTYTASCLVVDNDGDVGVDYENITINDLDPDLFVSYPAVLNEGENGTFNASSTTGILFEWDWNYLGIFNVSDIGASVVHAFMDNGIYTVAVRTFDGDSYNMTIFNINVLDLDPSAVLTGNISINEGEYADFDASLSTSWPDNIIGYEWDFDYTGVFNADASSLVPTINNQYNTSGNYAVAVRVLDEDSSSIATWNLTVIDSIPTAVLNANTTNIIEGDYVNFDASLSTGFDTPLSYLFDFNDGNVTLSSNPIIDHQFLQNGTYNVILTVIDSDGSNSTANILINALDTAPNNLNVIIMPNPGLANQTIYFNGSANAYDQPVSYVWDFGDFINGMNQNDTHSYAAAGNYTVVLTAIDADGSNITGNMNLEILDILVNNAPQLFNINPISPITINQSEIINFSADVLDVDGDNLIVNWFVDGVNIQNDSYVGSGSSSFANNFTLNGTYNVYVNVTDGFLVNDTTWIVNVLPVNGSLPNVTGLSIIINEIEINPGVGSEWFELYNPNSISVDLINWDAVQLVGGQSLIFNVSILPLSYTVINVTGLSNSGDGLTLFDSNGTVIDLTPLLVDNAGNNSCWARVPNGLNTSNFIFQTCTPGATNDILPDVTPPVVTLAIPVDGFLFGVNNVTVQYSVTDNMDLNLDCSIYSNTSGSFLNNANQTVANGTTSSFDYLGLSDGTYLWNVLCSDGVNPAFAPANFTFTIDTSVPDTTPPSIIINSPLPQTYNFTGILVSITAVDASGIGNIWFDYSNSTSTILNISYLTPINITFTDNDTTTLTAYVTDTFGNLNSTSVVFSVNTSAPFVDTILPVITINSPLNQSYNISNILFDINVTDNVQVDSILFNYGLGNITYSGLTSLNLSDGSYILTVYANDTSNLLSTSSVTFYVNTSIFANTPPTINIINPVQGANFTNGSLINFVGNGSDLEDINITDLRWLSNIDGNFANGSNLNFVLSNGYHTITLIGFDSGGLNGTASINVNVSIAIPPNTPPTLSVPNQTITEDIQASLNLGLYANDIDGDLLVFNVVTENASQVDCNISGNNLSFVPALNWNGIASCVISVSDGINPVVNNAVTITVNAVNDVPIVVILNPANLSSFVQGTIINFIGGNNDVEDGPLTGSWTSSIDGALAVSNNFNISTLSVGNHTITYTVTDSGSASNSTSIIVQITSLPLLNYTIFNSTIYGIFYPMNISSDVTVTSVVNSWLNNSVVQGLPVTSLINANLTYAILTNVNPIINCTVIGLPGNPSVITGGSCVNTYIDPSNITQSDTTGSSVTNSNISYSNATYSTVSGSNIFNSDINGSVIINTFLNGTIMDNSNVFGSNITNSSLTSVNATNSTIINSDLQNMSVNNANITNNIIYKGEINYTNGFINVTAPININNLPRVSLVAVPNSGTGSVVSVLTATISGTFSPAFFGWDFNNDGVVDSTTVIANVSNTYAASSTSRVTVNDTNGNYITNTVFITVNPSSPAPSGGGGGGGSGGGSSGVCGNIGELTEKTINTRTGCVIKFTYNDIAYSLKIADAENNALILGLFDAENNLISDGSALLNNSVRFNLGSKDLSVSYDNVDFGDLTVTLKVVDKLKPVSATGSTSKNIVTEPKEEISEGTNEQGITEYVGKENEITGSVISRLREKVDPVGASITLIIVVIGFIFYLKMRKKE